MDRHFPLSWSELPSSAPRRAIPEIWFREHRIATCCRRDLQGVRRRVDAKAQPHFGSVLAAGVLLFDRVGTGARTSEAHIEWWRRGAGFLQGTHAARGVLQKLLRRDPWLQGRLDLRAQPGFAGRSRLIP